MKTNPSWTWLLIGILMCASATLAQTEAGEDSPALEPVGSEDLDRILQELTPEQLDDLVESAARRQLEVERKKVIGEISQSILYDPEDVSRAVEVLQKDVKNTREDNIERICKAYSLVDIRCKGPFALYRKGQYQEAARELEKRLNPEDASYFSAALHYVCADAQIRSGKMWEGVDTYTEVLVNLPDRLSFAAASALKAAETYESMGRGLYAMQMYEYCLNHYALTLSKQQAETVARRINELRRIYRDPIKSAAVIMDQVTQRLVEADTGEKTQTKQKEIIALLEDLIKSSEEAQRQKDQKDQQRQKKSQSQGSGQAKQQGQQQGQGQSQSQSQSQGKGKQGSQNPSSPMQDSQLVPGPVARPSKLSQSHDESDSGRWADMPPREREKLESIMRQRVAEKRGEQVRDYHRRLSEGEE